MLSNKAANVLVDKANVQKGIVYLSLCQERLNYILPSGYSKIGAIVGPLFEAFMEKR